MSDNRKPSPEARRQRALRRLGTPNPACCICGEINPHCLELHHIAGRHNDPGILSVVCGNCHAKLSNEQRDHPGDISDPDDTLGRIAHFMLGLADMLALIVKTLREFAQLLFVHLSREGACDEAVS